MAERTGIQTVVDQAAADGELVAPVVQGDLFAGKGGAEDVAPATDDERLDAAVEKRGRGRPVGAKNKKSAALRDYIAGRYGNVAELLMARATAPVRDLAVELGADVMDVWKEQNDILKSVLPYVMEKMTPEQVQQNFMKLSIENVRLGDAGGPEVETIKTADFRQILPREESDD